LPHYNSGDTAWVLASAALVLFMTPGSPFFYGGMARRKNMLAMLMQNFVTMAIVCLAVGATVIGLVAGAACALAVSLKFKLKVDDSLDVLGVHGVGGFVGR
jgi:ammonia channel protein AmtB